MTKSDPAGIQTQYLWVSSRNTIVNDLRPLCRACLISVFIDEVVQVSIWESYVPGSAYVTMSIFRSIHQDGPEIGGLFRLSDRLPLGRFLSVLSCVQPYNNLRPPFVSNCIVHFTLAMDRMCAHIKYLTLETLKYLYRDFFSIWVHLRYLSLRIIWIHMLWIYVHYEYLTLWERGSTLNVKIWRLHTSCSDV